MLPFICIAKRHGQPPRRIGILARSKEDAIQNAKEIFPGWTLGVIEIEPEWTDDPA
jgi:hypothetical protein